jgi:hypothetical protein
MGLTSGKEGLSNFHALKDAPKTTETARFLTEIRSE